MKIDPKNNVEGVFQSNIQRKASNFTESGAAVKDNELPRDKIEISKKAAGYNELTAIKNQIAEKVQKGTDPKRLCQLKTMIENGTYQVDARDIADAILKADNKNETH